MKIKWQTLPVNAKKDWDCIYLDAESVHRMAEVSPNKNGYLLRVFIADSEIDRKKYRSLKLAKLEAEKWMKSELIKISKDIKALL